MNGHRSLAALLLGFLALVPSVVAERTQAQSLPTLSDLDGVFGPVVPGPGDTQVLREQTIRLLAGSAERRSLEWDNPQSGNRGSVSLQREFTRQTQPCRQLEYRIIHRAQDRPQIGILAWRKQADGRWMIVG
jgi:surface antigen